MRLVRAVLLPTIALAIALSVPAAVAGPSGVPISGTRSDTLTLSPTGFGTNVSAGVLSHIGQWTGTSAEQFTAPDSHGNFSWVGAAPSTLVAANGDMLTVTFFGLGHTNGDGTSTSQTFFTVVGGTGRFAGATGSLTESLQSTFLHFDSAGNSIWHGQSEIEGTISY